MVLYVMRRVLPGCTMRLAPISARHAHLGIVKTFNNIPDYFVRMGEIYTSPILGIGFPFFRYALRYCCDFDDVVCYGHTYIHSNNASLLRRFAP